VNTEQQNCYLSNSWASCPLFSQSVQQLFRAWYMEATREAKSTATANNRPLIGDNNNSQSIQLIAVKNV